MDCGHCWRARARWSRLASAKRLLTPTLPACGVSPYGWTDFKANQHLKNCSWVLPPEVAIEEVTYSEFYDTYSENSENIGINAVGVGESIRCACGKYSNVTLRYEASLGEVLTGILGLNATSIRI